MTEFKKGDRVRFTSRFNDIPVGTPATVIQGVRPGDPFLRLEVEGSNRHRFIFPNKVKHVRERGVIIGFTGLATGGKSASAQYLAERYGFERVSFAAPLKKMLRTLNPIMGCDIGYPVRLSNLEAWGLSEKQIKESHHGAEYRRLLQVLGTDCIRAVDEDFWVNAAMRDLPRDTPVNYVFDDVRFPNEARAITEAGGVLVHLDRPGLTAGEHSSEAHAGNLFEHRRIVNDGDIGDLYDQLDALVRSLGKDENNAG